MIPRRWRTGLFLVAERFSPRFLAVVLVFLLRTSPAQAQPVGPEFQVNTYTTYRQTGGRIATDSGGNFVVVWRSYTQAGVFGQRYSSAGAPLGTEFRLNTYTTGGHGGAGVASDSAGSFVVVWDSYPQDGSASGVFGQRFSSAGVPLGAEFRVNTYTRGFQEFPSVASASDGSFVVVWMSELQADSYAFDVFGQRHDGAGAPRGAEFRVNTYTTSNEIRPSGE